MYSQASLWAVSTGNKGFPLPQCKVNCRMSKFLCLSRGWSLDQKWNFWYWGFTHRPVNLRIILRWILLTRPFKVSCQSRTRGTRGRGPVPWLGRPFTGISLSQRRKVIRVVSGLGRCHLVFSEVAPKELTLTHGHGPNDNL